MAAVVIPGLAVIALDHFEVVCFPTEAVVLKRVDYIWFHLGEWQLWLFHD